MALKCYMYANAIFEMLYFSECRFDWNLYETENRKGVCKALNYFFACLQIIHSFTFPSFVVP